MIFHKYLSVIMFAACVVASPVLHAQTTPSVKPGSAKSVAVKSGWFLDLIQKNKLTLEKELGPSKKIYGANVYKKQGYFSIEIMYGSKDSKALPFVSALNFSTANVTWSDGLRQAGFDPSKLSAKKVTREGLSVFEISGVKGLPKGWVVEFMPETTDMDTKTKCSSLSIGDPGKDG